MHAKLTIKGKDAGVDGRFPVLVYYQEKGATIRFNTKVRVKPEDWDEERQVIRGKEKQIESLNDLLRKSLTRANQIITWFHLHDKPVSLERFKEEMMQTESRNAAVDWIEEQISRDYERGLFSHQTRYMKLRLVKRLKEYDPVATWADMNRDWLDRFDAHMSREFQKKDTDGVREREKMLKYLKSYTTRAKEAGFTLHDMWKGFKIKKAPNRVIYMNEKEMAELERLYDDTEYLKERMAAYAEEKGMTGDRVEQYVRLNADDVRRHLRSFLFQCYSGVRVSDAQRLMTSDIEGDYLVFTPHKTREVSGKTVRLPITEKMRKYMNTQRTGKILPGISSSQKYNEGLKPVAWMIGTVKNLTTHVARHTFATMAVARGVSLISLRDLLGVTSVKTVEIYAHSSLEQQEREMRRAFE